MSDRAAATIGSPSSDNPGALDLAMRDSARSLAKWAAILFSLFIVTDTLLFAPPVDRILPAFDAVLAIVYAATWLAASRGLLPARHAGATAAGILLAVLPYLMTLLWLTGQPLQSTALDPARRGTGLGLYICKGIVERHGGTMGASSLGPGQGATFWFELPPAPA
ncbi:MAG: ATP-binding protein [Candidatus Thermoplasmatota archaeon]